MSAEVLEFVGHIIKRPELWLDFPVSVDEGEFPTFVYVLIPICYYVVGSQPCVCFSVFLEFLTIARFPIQHYVHESLV